MAVPTDRDTFAAYCLRELGAGATTVNVTTEQVQDRIDEALFRFWERHPNGVHEEYILYNFQRADMEKGYLSLPPDIQAVTDLFVPSQSGGVFSIEFQLQLEML